MVHLQPPILEGYALDINTFWLLSYKNLKFNWFFVQKCQKIYDFSTDFEVETTIYKTAFYAWYDNPYLVIF